MNQSSPIVIALKRQPDYSDVHAELVIEDAMRPGWACELLRDEGTAVVIAIDRPEGYERSSAAGLAREAIRPDWPSWSVVKT
ncbi:MAG TPA: hypothetical protein VGM81_22325 [Burkholderiaceae bacterium]|jgi:hypothetical protein